MPLRPLRSKPLDKDSKPKEPVEGQLLYPVPLGARVVGISPSLLWKFIGCGEVKTRRVGKRVLVPRAELEKFAAKDHETS
jgi:hypothetical protein